ncbi:cyclin-domain-containing protein [Helicostylum pulchrum]|nr:cyclin-domain-containing protein [Helicostylum pulchrum]
MNQTYNKKQQDALLVSTNRLAYVEALVDINAVVIETIWCNHSVIKESRVSPVVPLRTFIQEVLKRSRTTYSTLQTALFYLFRSRNTMMNHLQQNNAYISCGRRMFLASLIVASKFVQDKTYRNSAWAKIAGLPVQEINTAERYFLNILNYRLYIEQSTFDRWHKLLHIRTQARIHNIPTSIHDLTCLSFTPKYHHHNQHYPIIQCTSTYSNITTINTSTIHSPTYPPPPLSLSLPSSISSSPAQTPTQISPVRITTTTTTQQKRKNEDREHASLLDKKHCRLW